MTMFTNHGISIPRRRSMMLHFLVKVPRLSKLAGRTAISIEYALVLARLLGYTRAWRLILLIVSNAHRIGLSDTKRISSRPT